MKALSIRQPWAWAIFHAGKDIENRDWPTRLRGRIAIHAAKGMTGDEYWNARLIIGSCTDLQIYPPLKSELVRGAIIGTAEIAGCVSESASPWFTGNYGFVLRDVVALPEPIECRGALGFWDVPSDIEQLIVKT